MTIAELDSKLKELGIPEESYYLHGLFGSTDDDEKLALVIKRGKYTIEYEVYRKARGQKSVIMIFISEDEACQYFLKRFNDIKTIENKYLK